MLRARKNDLAARAAERARVAAARQATGRAKFLAVQTKAISVQHRKLQGGEKAALKRALANRGYQPGTTDPREMARQILKNKYGYGEDQFDCFNNIIMRESMWRVNGDEPQLRGVRDPAGAARVQDGQGRPATGGPTRPPRSSGPSST